MSVTDSSKIELDYLAKDFASFRQLMLDQLTLRVPDWQERNPADLGNVIVELLAYAADHLSYYQDAVATEAYLGTARQIASVRRHARLLDYHAHQGCNARVWVQVQVIGDEVQLPAGTALFSKTKGTDTGSVLIHGSSDHENLCQSDALAFETMHPARLYQSHNQISLLPNQNGQTFLPRGTTHARLHEHADDPLHLNVGDVLIFEAIRDASTGQVAGADPTHRHAVRLTQVSRPTAATVQRNLSKLLQSIGGTHPLAMGTCHAVDVHWAAADELPFDLALVATQQSGPALLDVSVARGNIVLADHGRTLPPEPLADVTPSHRYRPTLRHQGITHHVPYDHHAARNVSASVAMNQAPHQSLAALKLFESFPRSDDRFDPDAIVRGADSYQWTVHRDLLNSSRFARHFVLETSRESAAHLRFGFGNLGKMPVPGDRFVAQYRIGNGIAGNVGAGAIANVVVDENLASQIRRVVNPIPGRGGTDPEPIDQARLRAPHAYQEQRRCVTADDHAVLAKRFPTVVDAVAETRTTGTGPITYVHVRRIEGLSFSSEFRDELAQYFETYRVIGHEFSLQPPRYAALQVEMALHVGPHHHAATVVHRVQSELSDDRRAQGFFHPENFRFGQTVYQSQVIDRVMSVPGVERVELTQFGRLGDSRVAQTIPVSPTEIARLDRPVVIRSEGGL